jgi:Sec-independent protein secretion pathway component TatC
MDKKTMPFLDHLEELRWHLIRSILAIVIAGGAAFLAKDFIFDVLLGDDAFVALCGATLCLYSGAPVF